MPTKKKRAFTKNNSVKFLLLRGNENAENADGETLKTVLVPISRNYKPGRSLILGRIAELVNESNPPGRETKEGDLEKILDQFEDASDCGDSEFDEAKNGIKNLRIKDHLESLGHVDVDIEEEYEEDEEYAGSCDGFSDSDGDFSDTSDPLCSLKPDCPENLKILEERMKEKLKEYGDDQLGALDNEEIGGYLTGNSERVNNFIDPLSKEEEEDIGMCDKSLKEKILKYSQQDTEENIVEVVTEKPIEYDCESIISTYSNKYNHPVLIKEEAKVRKIKIPANPLRKQLTKSQLKQLDSESEEEISDDDNFSVASTVNTRVKGETPEQRRERKQLFKEAKRESRILKKENKLAFKEEKKLQKSQAMNAQYTRGVRLL